MLEEDDSANACGWKETCDHGDANAWNLEGNVKGSLELGRKREWKLGDVNCENRCMLEIQLKFSILLEKNPKSSAI
ncbi:hypothetical protein L6452_00785 [Arctium lappa]|uniref:Uncharacterized protein n=1 Tax=Arctium lappa TaxID=4217 RepID=A0ACB9FFP7_ARCLA|nr:hypothetical protein L6452_00785 [Arctium lappa]